MRLSRRSIIAIAVVLLLGVLVFVGRWYEAQRSEPGVRPEQATFNVTQTGDRGPGTLREALFLAAAADRAATISIRVKDITLETALPPLVSAHGLRIIAGTPGAQINASRLPAGAVLDVAGPQVSIEGIAIRHCPAAGILLRATRFHLQASTIEACDVGVEIAENAADVLLERNRFADNRLGLRFAASSRNTVVVKNEFERDKDAGIWAVRSAPDLRGGAISVRDNRHTQDRIGILAGNVSLLIERNQLLDSREAAVHLVGAGSVLRGNRISGGAAMGIIAENARASVIDANELDHLTAYGIMIKNSPDTLVRNNRMHNCGYGMAFVLGDARSPSTAVENTIIEPQFNGIDVVGDSPILRRNHVLRPRALALSVSDFQPPGGQKIVSRPLLDNNNFGSAPAAVAGIARPAAGAATTR